MSAVEIYQEERDLWRFEASDECGTPSEEDERILRLLKALEATESDLERSCEETRANFSELYRMANEVVPELKKRIADAEARVKAKGKHITTLMSEALENERNFDGMKSQWQTSEAQVARLNKMVDWLADKLETSDGCPYGDLDLECPFCASPGSEACAKIIDAIPNGEIWTYCWKEAARKSVEGK